MASDVLVRLRLLGAKVFAAGSASASRDLEKIGAAGKAAGLGMDATAAGSDRAQSALDRVRAATTKTTTELDVMGDRAALAGERFKAGLEGATFLLGLGGAFELAHLTEEANEFQERIARVGANTGATNRQLRKMERVAKSMGDQLGVSGTEGAEGLYELSKAGFTAGDSIKVLPSTMRLAKIGFLDLKTAAEVQAHALRGFQLPAKASAHVADVLSIAMHRSTATIEDLGIDFGYVSRIAHHAGLTFDETTAALVGLGRAGLTGSKAGTGLRRVLTNLIAPTSTVEKGLEAIGIQAGELTDPKRGLKELPVVVERLRKGLSGLNKPSQLAVMKQIFGQWGLEAGETLLSSGANELRALTKEFDRSRGASQRMVREIQDNLKGSLDKLDASIKNTAISLLQRLQPALKKAADAARRAIPAIGHGALEFGRGLFGGETQIHAPIYIPTASSARSPNKVIQQTTKEAGLLQRIGASARGVVTTIGKAIGSVAGQLLGALKPALPFLRNVLLPLLIGIGKGVLSNVVFAFKLAIPIIKIVAGALGLIGKAAKPLSPIIEKVGEVVGFLLGGEILDIIKLGEKAAVVLKLLKFPITFVDDAARLAGKGIQLFADGVQYLNRWLRFGDGVISKALGKITNFASGLIGLPGKLLDALERVAGKIPQDAGKFGKFALKLGEAIIKGILTVVEKAPGRLLAALASIVPSPKSIIKTVGHGIKTFAEKLPGDVVNVGEGVSKLFGKHAEGGFVRSPFQLVGEYGPELAAFPRGTRILTAGQTHRHIERLNGAMRPIVIEFAPTLDSRVIHRSVHHVEQQALDAR